MIQLGLLVVLSVHVVHAADWPRFRGPNGSGVADGAALPVELKTNHNLLWRTELPEGLSSPVLSERHLFLTGIEDQQLVTLCLDRATGRILWRRHLDRPRTEKLHQLNHPAAPSAVTDGRSVYAFFGDFGLISYSLDGGERWRTALGPFQNSYGMGASPVLAGEKLILVCDQHRDSFVAGFDKNSGKELWRQPRPDALSGHSTPIVHGNWVIAPGSFRLDAYDAGSGQIVWSTDGLPSEMKSGPVIDGEMLYVHGFDTPDHDPGRLIVVPPFAQALESHDANRDGRLSKAETPTQHSASRFNSLDLNRDGSLDETEWAKYARTMKAENALLAYKLGGELVWKFQRSIPQLPSPLVYRGVVYLINESGVLTTLDAATGKLHKQARLRGESDRYYASPVAGDGKVYFASHTGVITVLRAGPDQELLAVNRLEEEVLATPALVDGRIYLRSRGALLCFGRDSGPK